MISTVGGHLAQLETLAQAVAHHDRYLVTVPSPHTSYVLPGVRRYTVRQILRNPVNLLVNLLQSLRIVLKERPDAVVTTGAGDALPTVLLSSLLGSAVVFAESLARVRTPSLFGRLAHRWCDLVIVQWPDLRRAYPEAVLVAPLFPLAAPRGTLPADASILILTGTHTRGFERLLRSIDVQVERGQLSGRAFAQIGHSDYLPRNYPYARFLPHTDLMERLSKADLVVTHDGSASIGESLAAGKPTVVVPRTRANGEVSYGSGQELARHLADLRFVELVTDPDDLPLAVNAFRSRRPLAVPSRAQNAVDTVRVFLERWYRHEGEHGWPRPPTGIRPVIVSPVNPWGARPSGMRSYVEQLVSGLIDEGIPVTVATVGKSPFGDIGNLRRETLFNGPLGSIRFLIVLGIRGRRLSRMGNILHVQRLDHLLPLLPWTKSVRRVVTLHGLAAISIEERMGPLRALAYRTLEAVASRFGDRLIAVDGRTKNWYETRLPWLRGSITVVPVGVSPPKPSNSEVAPASLREIPGDAQMVLFAGRFEPEKNVPLLLASFEKLHERFPRAWLVLVGEGRDEDLIRTEIRFRGLTQVLVIPTLPHPSLWGLLRRADVLAVPSRFESGPLIALEAIAAGTPVVSTPVGRIEGIVERWPVGKVSTLEPESFAGALADVVEMGKAYYAEACISASKDLSFASTLKETIRTYESLVPSGGKP